MPLFVLSACVHQRAEEVVPVCSPSNPLNFSADISPILNAKCNVKVCHDGSNGKLPSLVTLEEAQSNAADIVFQVSRGAMPPAGSTALTAVEKAAILCWAGSQ